MNPATQQFNQVINSAHQMLQQRAMKHAQGLQSNYNVGMPYVNQFMQGFNTSDPNPSQLGSGANPYALGAFLATSGIGGDVKGVETGLKNGDKLVRIGDELVDASKVDPGTLWSEAMKAKQGVAQTASDLIQVGPRQYKTDAIKQALEQIPAQDAKAGLYDMENQLKELQKVKDGSTVQAQIDLINKIGAIKNPRAIGDIAKGSETGRGNPILKDKANQELYDSLSNGFSSQQNFGGSGLAEQYATPRGQKLLNEIISQVPKENGKIVAYRVGEIKPGEVQSYTISPDVAKNFSQRGYVNRDYSAMASGKTLPIQKVLLDPNEIKGYSPHDRELLVSRVAEQPLSVMKGKK